MVFIVVVVMTLGAVGAIGASHLPFCEVNDCVNGGTCYESLGGKVCECQPGYYGEKCSQESPCLRNDICQNGGKCVRSRADRGFDCICPENIGGVNCEIVDPCGNVGSCLNGGTCVATNTLEGYECSCRRGYSGTYCQRSSPCLTEPPVCQNDGTCHDYGFGYYCWCGRNHYGDHCEYGNICVRSNPCQNGGMCHGGTTSRTTDEYFCVCPEMYSGKNCTVADPCLTDNGGCLNGANCSSISLLKDGWLTTCCCVDGYTGQKCEKESPCKTFGCVNGLCYEDTDGAARCLCETGYTGVKCDQALCSLQPSLCGTLEDPDPAMSFSACRSETENYLTGRRTCLTTQYKETIGSKDCWCDSSQVFDLALLAHPDLDNRATINRCIGKLNDQEGPDCNWEAVYCGRLFVQAKQHITSGTECDQQLRANVTGCFQRLKSGLLTLSGCEAYELIYNSTGPYLMVSLAVLCSDCNIAEKLEACMIATGQVDVCQQVEDNARAESMNCFLAQLEADSACFDVISFAEDVINQALFTERKAVEAACQKVAEYEGLKASWECSTV